MTFLLNWLLLPNFALATTGPWLSTLRQEGAKNCAWESITPSGKASALVAFPNTCSGATLTRAKSGKQALVQFGGILSDGDDKAPPGYPLPPFKKREAPGAVELWRVTLGSPKAKLEKLSPPLNTKFDRVGFDENDNVIGLKVIPLPRKLKVTKAKDKEGEIVERFQFNHKSYTMPEVTQGIRALAQALRYESDGKWVEIETAPTTTAWDYGSGVAELKIAKRWEKKANPEGGWTEKSNDSIPELLRGLAKYTPENSEDGSDNWKVMESSEKKHGRLAIWQEVGEFRNDSGLIVFLAPLAKEFSQLSKLDYNRSVQPKITFRGDYGLITTSGTSSHPRVYDMRNGELAFSSDSTSSVAFWE